MEKITFMNRGLKMAGNLFFPNDFDKSKRYPAIAVCHPGGGVKEQTAGKYAEAVAKSGLIALAFDASYQGESEGEPRGLEDPYARVEDISAAIDCLQSLSYVDENRVGALGICAGGGYTICAATYDKRIKAAATVSGADAGVLNRGGFGEDFPPQPVLNTLASVAEERTKEATGAPVKMINILPSKDTFDENTPAMVREAYDYYCTPRAQHPRADNKMPLISNAKILSFDAFAHVSTLLTQPVLMIAGSKADTKFMSDYVIEHAASNNKEEYVVDGASHVDLYDKPEYFPKVAAKLSEFYNANL